MALRCSELVTVAITGPRSMGSAAPHLIGKGRVPEPSGWEVNLMCVSFFFFKSVMCFSSRRHGKRSVWTSAHPIVIGLDRPFGRDLFQVAPEVEGGLARDVALAELRLLGAAE